MQIEVKVISTVLLVIKGRNNFEVGCGNSGELIFLWCLMGLLELQFLSVLHPPLLCLFIP